MAAAESAPLPVSRPFPANLVLLPRGRVRTMHALDALEATIWARKAAAETAASYTARLLAGGVATIGAKVLEEAGETAEAAAEPGDDGRAHLVAEAGDLIYHLLVLLAARDVRLAEVAAELARRFGQSGLAEKASRRSSTS